jgi:hypothetical protein
MTRLAQMLAVPLWLVLAAEAMPAQQAQALIVGRVVDGESSAGVAGAAVTFTVPPAPGQPASPPGSRPAVLTDAEGRFVLSGVPPGRLNLGVNARGYLGQQYGALRPGGTPQTLELAAGERLVNVVVRIWKGATVSGRILDDGGEPVEGVQIGILRREIVGGRLRFSTAGAAQSDDRGVYRSTPLLPGNYIVTISTTMTTMPRSAMDLIADAQMASQEEMMALNRALMAANPPALQSDIGYRVGDFLAIPSAGGPAFTVPPDANGRLMVTDTRFFPSATSPDEATVLTVGPGDVRSGVDFHLRVAPSVPVSGVVTRADGAPAINVGVRLSVAGMGHLGTFMPMETGATMTDAQGRFTFLGVPRGTYVIRARVVPPQTPAASAPSASAPILSAVVPVSVGDTPVNGVVVALAETARVSGRVEFDTASAPPAPAQVSKLAVELQAVDPRYPPTVPEPRGLAGQNGEFTTSGVTPGSYVVRAAGLPGWTLKSALKDGKDLSDDPFDPTADLTGVVVTMTDRAATVSGTVSRSDGAPDPDAAVIVFPFDTANRGTRRRQLVRVDKSGAYTISGLPAGEYRLIAIDERIAVDWEEPAFLTPASRVATRVTVPATGSIAVDLRTTAVRREAR